MKTVFLTLHVGIIPKCPMEGEGAVFLFVK